MTQMTRPSLKESVGTAVNTSNMKSDILVEGAADRLAALARADALGSALWRLKAGGDLTVLKRAAALLALRARREFLFPASPALMLEICSRILNEWLQDKCPKCKGRGRTGMGTGSVVRQVADCEGCAGSGRSQHIGGISAALLESSEYGPISPELRHFLLSTTKPCPDCSGAGKVMKDKTVNKTSLGKPCYQCLGTGRSRVNGAERAVVVGVTRQAYWQTWDVRFNAVRHMLAVAEGEPAEKVRAALRGPRPATDPDSPTFVPVTAREI